MREDSQPSSDLSMVSEQCPPKFDIEETCASEFRKEVAETDSLYIEVPSAPEDIRTAIIECTRTQRILGLEQIVVPAPLIDETGLTHT